MLRNAIASMALAAALALPASGADAFDETKYPDWSGQWGRVPDGGPPRYDTTKPLRAQQAPMKPEYRALHEASMEDQDAGGVGLDLAVHCIPQGMPRQMSGVSPMEFLISPTVTHILFELMSITTRRIYTDGRDWPRMSSRPTAATRSATGPTRTAAAATTPPRWKPASCTDRAPGIKAACRPRATTRA